MNYVLARAACDFKDDARRRQDIEKDIENEIAIAYCCRRVLAVIGHFPHGLEFSCIPSFSHDTEGLGEGCALA